MPQIKKQAKPDNRESSTQTISNVSNSNIPSSVHVIHHDFHSFQFFPTRNTIHDHRSMSSQRRNMSPSHLVRVLSQSLHSPNTSSKYLYNFTTTKPKQRIDLETEDTGPLCCQELGHDWVSRHRHREQCHSISYEKHKACNDASGHKTPPMKRCRTSRYGMAHCECFTRRSRLHFRLAGWIGGGLKYCGTCGKFTKRKKQHNGRCESVR